MLARMWKNWITYLYIAGENINGTAILENNLAVFLKKHATTIGPNNCTTGHLFHRNDDLCSYKNLYMNIYSGFVHNGPKLETIKMFLNR